MLKFPILSALLAGKLLMSCGQTPAQMTATPAHPEATTEFEEITDPSFIPADLPTLEPTQNSVLEAQSQDPGGPACPYVTTVSWTGGKSYQLFIKCYRTRNHSISVRSYCKGSWQAWRKFSGRPTPGGSTTYLIYGNCSKHYSAYKLYIH